MKCMHCGADNPQQAQACARCGRELQAAGPAGRHRADDTYRPEEVRENQPFVYSPDEVIQPAPDYGETEPFAATRQKRRRPARQNVQQGYPPYQQPPYQQQGYQQQGYPNGQPAYPPNMQRRPRQKSRVPYLVVSFLTAVISVLAFFLPFMQWVSYEFQLFGYDVQSGRYTLFELVKKFYENDNIFSMLSGADNEYIQSLIPEEINQQFATGRLFMLGVALVFIVALFLYLLMILSVLLRAKGAAAAFGILGSLLYAGGALGVMYAVGVVNNMIVYYDSLSWNLIQIKLLDMPYAALTLSVFIFFMCILFAALGAGTRRRSY